MLLNFYRFINNKIFFSSLSKIKTIAILGAGLSGLSLALNLKNIGFHVTVFEKQSTSGGLASSNQYGPYVFDTGAHIFRTSDEKLFQFVSKLTPIYNISYSAGMWKNNQLQKASYPVLSKKSLNSLNSTIQVQALIDYNFAKENIPLDSTDHNSFEDVVKSHVGNTLFREYFQFYAEKFWGLKSSQISGAIAPKQILLEDEGKWSHYTTSFKKPKFEIYPKKGGSSSFVIGLEKLCIESGVKILKNSKLVDIKKKLNKNFITFTQESKFQTNSFDFIFSTIPITALANLMHVKTSLNYRSLVIVDISVSKSKVFDDAWVYFHDNDISFIRATDMSNYGQYMSSPNSTGLMLEVTCQQNDKIWNDVNISNKIIDEFLKIDLVKRDEIKLLGIRKISHAYPLFEKGFVKKLNEFQNSLKNFESICLAGRTGAFAYLNMDGCIKYFNYDLNSYMKNNITSLEKSYSN